jgi:hypothetical protein
MSSHAQFYLTGTSLASYFRNDEVVIARSFKKYKVLFFWYIKGNSSDPGSFL